MLDLSQELCTQVLTIFGSVLKHKLSDVFLEVWIIHEVGMIGKGVGFDRIVVVWDLGAWLSHWVVCTLGQNLILNCVQLRVGR